MQVIFFQRFKLAGYCGIIASVCKQGNLYQIYDLDGDKMKVTKKDMENVAVLSRLDIPADKEAQYTQQLNDVLEYFDNLSAVNTDDIKPLAHVLPISNVFREDVVKESLDRDLALSNAPLKEDGYFKVPKVLED